ncbi:MAG: Trk system potassium transporter TrkA [Oscillospiraceae bacterium]|nr:Trk system potassium transporter TrkA [Oscillospiraceae bacterium]
MRIVIIGCGKIGGKLAGVLSEEGHDVVAVDASEEVTSRLSDRYDVMSLQGNGATLDVQREAGVDRADVVIATTEKDEANILCCLLARKLGAKHTIARVRDPAYSGQLDYMRDELELSMSINPELATATEIFRTIRNPAAGKVETFAGGRVEIIETRVREDGQLAGVALKDAQRVTGVKLLICAVERGSEVIIPKGDFVLNAGDRISIAASNREVQELFRRWGNLRRGNTSVLLIGGSRTAVYLARQLLAARYSVTVIDNDRERCLELTDLLPGAHIVCGDGTDPELLDEEGIRDFGTLVSLTGDDENNIIISLFAASHGVGKVIAKVNRTELAEMASDTLLESVVSPRSVCAGNILQYVRSMANTEGSNVETLYRIVGEKVEALEFRAAGDPEITGKPLRDLPVKRNHLIACIIRGEKVIIPGGSDEIKKGDHVVVVTTENGLDDLRGILA